MASPLAAILPAGIWRFETIFLPRMTNPIQDSGPHFSIIWRLYRGFQWTVKGFVFLTCNQISGKQLLEYQSGKSLEEYRCRCRVVSKTLLGACRVAPNPLATNSTRVCNAPRSPASCLPVSLAIWITSDAYTTAGTSIESPCIQASLLAYSYLNI